jgi:hypothetical protein
MRLLKRISRKKQHDGTAKLLKSVPSFCVNEIYRERIRPHQPIRRYTVWNGVKMSPKRSAVRKFDLLLPSSLRDEDYAKSENGEVAFHKEYTRSGDNVNIIGGGRGVTTVHAAWMVEPDGRVTVFEGSAEMVDIVKDTVRINGVSDLCNIRHSLVGPGLNVYTSGKLDVEAIHPGELPECDVLEMDCEGAELDLLREMVLRPDVLIIEVHPRRHSVGSVDYMAELTERLENKDFTIEGRRDNEGEPLTEQEFNTICHSSLDEHPGAPILAAVHRSADRGPL